MYILACTKVYTVQSIISASLCCIAIFTSLSCNVIYIPAILQFYILFSRLLDGNIKYFRGYYCMVISVSIQQYFYIYYHCSMVHTVYSILLSTVWYIIHSTVLYNNNYIPPSAWFLFMAICVDPAVW